MAAILQFSNHPLKDDILRRWNNNESNQSINKWLKAEHPDLVLSVVTLSHHHKKFIESGKKIDSLGAGTERMVKTKRLPIEKILWETIGQCRKKKKDTTISVKEWQYLDQQLQLAIEKLIRIQDSSGDTRDISVILADVLQKIEDDGEIDPNTLHSTKELNEAEKLKIAQEVDAENENNTETSSGVS